ncbi:glycosyl hydrolase family 18 protein [Vibrio sp. E150_011]
MNRIVLGASLLTLAMSNASWAAPATPAIDAYGSNNLQFSKVQLAMETTAGYSQMVQYQDAADITIKFNQWSGTPGDTYHVYFDGSKVATGPITGSQTAAIFTYAKGGRYQVQVEACDASGCAKSSSMELVVADTDGSHLPPLVMNVDPNNKSFDTDPNTVVGTYFVEWGIYGRDFTVDNIPVDNLTHIIYGFIPICGPNESVKSVGGNSFNALQTACQGMDDYEVVIHDPWAAYQKSFSQAGHEYSSPIKGNYAMLMALKQRNPDLKILPSIGGWTLSDPFYSFTDKANRDVFVASVKQFLTTWKFYDGVDIDWEYPGGDGAVPDLGDPSKDGAAYAVLMQELRAMLDQLSAETGRTYELTSAVGVGFDKIQDVDYAQAVPFMDYIFAMTYDFYGGWNNVPGHQAGLYCGSFMRVGQCDGSGVDAEGVPYKGPAYTADNGIELLLSKGVPANKLVLGAAMYGRGWEGVMPSTLTDPTDPMTGTASGKLKGSTAQGVWEDGVIDYKGIKSFMLGDGHTGINGYEYGYDALAEAAYVWNQTTGALITFDDNRSVKAKGAYARSLGLAGLFSWEIDADNGDILNAMHEGLAGGTPSNRPPKANAGVDQYVEGPMVLSLSGAASSDSDGNIVSYAWTQSAGSPLVLVDKNTVTLQVNIGEVTENNKYEFVLTVTDNEGATHSDTVVVNVAPNNTKPTNTPPVARITGPTSAVANEVVLLDASSSTDIDNDVLTYIWQSPAGLSVKTQGDILSFNAPSLPESTDYQFIVTVSDGSLNSVMSHTVTVAADTGGVVCENTWQADSVYTGGEQVIYKGNTYQAKWWTQGEDPQTTGEWGVWKNLGNCL